MTTQESPKTDPPRIFGVEGRPTGITWFWQFGELSVYLNRLPTCHDAYVDSTRVANGTLKECVSTIESRLVEVAGAITAARQSAEGESKT